MASRLPPMDNTGLNMTPMIDIVFQLLSFFIFTLKITTQEGDFKAFPCTSWRPKAFAGYDPTSTVFCR